MTLLNEMDLGTGQLSLEMESMEDREYLPVVIRKSFRGFLGDFQLLEVFRGLVREVRVGYLEGGFAGKNPSELIIDTGDDG